MFRISVTLFTVSGPISGNGDAVILLCVVLASMSSFPPSSSTSTLPRTAISPTHPSVEKRVSTSWTTSSRLNHPCSRPLPRRPPQLPSSQTTMTAPRAYPLPLPLPPRLGSSSACRRMKFAQNSITLTPPYPRSSPAIPLTPPTRNLTERWKSFIVSLGADASGTTSILCRPPRMDRSLTMGNSPPCWVPSHPSQRHVEVVKSIVSNLNI
jgi:hypothetical protein